MPLKNLKRMVAGAANLPVILELLSAVRDEVSDVGVKIPIDPELDTIQVRKAIRDILNNLVDELRRIKKNSGSRDDEDDDPGSL